MAALLEVRGLCKSFGAVTAAKDINVEIRAAEVVGVIGSNGAGKTAFINMVTGYLKPSAGTIRFKDREITGLPPRQVTRAGVGRSFQIAQLFPALTVLDNMLVAVSMLLEGRLSWIAPLHTAEREKKALEVLAKYAIEGHAAEPVSTLSQGVRKLLDIAMSTVSAPDLVLLDEPTSGVAIDDKFALMDNVMGAVRASGAGCLFVEHDMEIVARYAARVMAFYEGRILADGPMQQVLDNPEVRQYVIGSEIHRRN